MKPPAVKSVEKIAHFIGSRLGGPASTAHAPDPLVSSIVGMAALTVARRVLPARFALIGAAIATGYATRKLAQRAERRAAMGESTDTPSTQSRKKKLTRASAPGD